MLVQGYSDCFKKGDSEYLRRESMIKYNSSKDPEHYAALWGTLRDKVTAGQDFNPSTWETRQEDLCEFKARVP